MLVSHYFYFTFGHTVKIIILKFKFFISCSHLINNKNGMIFPTTTKKDASVSLAIIYPQRNNVESDPTSKRTHIYQIEPIAIFKRNATKMRYYLKNIEAAHALVYCFCVGVKFQHNNLNSLSSQVQPTAMYDTLI